MIPESLQSDLAAKLPKLARVEVAAWSTPEAPVYRVLCRVGGVVEEVYTGTEKKVRGFFDLPDPVPPFPQEPAFGSPAAVEQAAETMRCGSCGGRGYVPDEGAGSRACRDCNGDGHLPTFPDEPAPDLLAERDRLLSEVERLKVREALLFNSNREIREQRDALADELEALRHFVTRACCGPGRPASGELSSILIRTEEALRNAGRLP